MTPPGEILLYHIDYKHLAEILRRWPILGDFGVRWHHAALFWSLDSPHVGAYSSAATLCALTKNRNPARKKAGLRNLVRG